MHAQCEAKLYTARCTAVSSQNVFKCVLSFSSPVSPFRLSVLPPRYDMLHLPSRTSSVSISGSVRDVLWERSLGALPAPWCMRSALRSWTTRGYSARRAWTVCSRGWGTSWEEVACLRTPLQRRRFQLHTGMDCTEAEKIGVRALTLEPSIPQVFVLWFLLPLMGGWHGGVGTPNCQTCSSDTLSSIVKRCLARARQESSTTARQVG